MSQFLDHRPNGDFMIYYTRPHLAGTADFEHKVYVNLARLRHGRRPEGTEDEDTLIVECPCGCGHVAAVPAQGDEEARRLHGRYRAYRQGA